MCWMLNGVLVTFLADSAVFKWDSVQIGWLLGIPILSGSLLRLPIGMLTDKFGGKWVFGFLLLFCSIPMFFLSYTNSFATYAILSFGWGMVGTGFATGIAFSSVWFPKEKQGTALGIFGAGNAGAAITTLLAPSILKYFTDGGLNIEGWRMLPRVYAGVLIVMGIIFLIFTNNKKPESAAGKTIKQQLSPLAKVRVWRFGLYYFLVFGCFVAFSQWLVPYYVNAYYMSLVTAGILASIFSLPSGLIRALGGWISDKWGARRVMYWVLGFSVSLSFLLIFPRMEIYSPGSGIMASKGGTVTEVTHDEIVVGEKNYKYANKEDNLKPINDDRTLIFPTVESWQEPVVKAGDNVQKKELLSKGTTRIYFQANVWIFTIFVMLIGIAWGIGKAAVYKYIPDSYPNDIGVVGGMVGVLGGLGGFVCPIIFGYLISFTGLWTSSWMLMFMLSAICLIWLHSIVTKIMNSGRPLLNRNIERND